MKSLGGRGAFFVLDASDKRPEGATHFVAPTSACTGSTFTSTGQASCIEMLSSRSFVSDQCPPLDFRLFVISCYLATTNTHLVGPVLTLLNHFHLFPLGSLARSAEGARKGHLLCSTE